MRHRGRDGAHPRPAADRAPCRPRCATAAPTTRATSSRTPARRTAPAPFAGADTVPGLDAAAAAGALPPTERRRPRPPPPRHHRPQPAAATGRWPRRTAACGSPTTARSTTTSSCATSCARAGTPSAPRPTPRSARRLRGMGRGRAAPRLNGMWAFAIYDAARAARALLRARPLRREAVPLLRGRRAASPSPPRSRACSPIRRVRARAARAAASPTSSWRGALDEDDGTFFEDVRRFPPAHRLTARPAHARRRRRPPLVRAADAGAPRPDAARRGCATLLEDAVRLRLRSDVDVGTCLSGGLDSSSIVALTARLRGGTAAGARSAPSTTTPASTSARSWPRWWRPPASRGGARRRPRADLLRDLPALVRHQDEPIPSAGPYSHWRVMALARETRE